jgi:DNA recombination protein RmuC
MDLTIIYIIIALAIGIVITWFWSNANFNKKLQRAKDAAQIQYGSIEREYVGFKATADTQLAAASKTEQQLKEDITALNQSIELKQNESTALNNQLATATANHKAANDTLITKGQEIEQLKKEVTAIRQEWETNSRLLATAEAENNALQQNLITQKEAIEELNKKFTTEFENIANKILDTKTQKFTDLNKENLKGILEPLGKNIDEFKKQVDEVYKAESKERFSLGNEVKRLSDLNQLLGEEAKNLVRALKGESKTQGRWGEVILETILQKSGLRKGEEYFMEYQLFDAEGKPLRIQAEGKKMRPDALVMYPDNRHIIIDAKVSLNAFVRFIESDDEDQQKAEIVAHVSAIKGHINELSKRAYDDYDKTLDFVMMFIPNEPAYSAAMQGEPDLWNYAYERRILLISPTNLIASLKLMVDLWKREYQNQNAHAIAERGAKMYDKFVGFIENLEDVGVHLGKAQGKYYEAFKQLNSGNDNLVSQATKLKALGLKNKKELPAGMCDLAIQNDLQLPETNI